MKTTLNKISLVLLTILLTNFSYSQCDIFDDFENTTIVNWTVEAGTNNISQDEAHSGSSSLKMTLNADYPKIISTQSDFDFGE